MESKQYVDLFMLSLSYERVYKDPFHEIVREYIQQLDNSKLVNEFQNLEKTYNQIIEKISQYKLDYTSIETDKFKTTQEKEKTKELLFNNFYPDLLNNITNYLQNKTY